MTTTPIQALAASVAAPAAAASTSRRSTTPDDVLKRTNRFFIDPKDVTLEEDWNHRFDMGDIELLSRQIDHELKTNPSSGGLIHDLHVKRIAGATKAPFFTVVDGERRLAAITILLKKGVEFPDGVPAKINTASADKLELRLRSFVANGGKSLLPLEQANAFKEFQDAGMTLKEIEKATGFTNPTIVSALALLTADESVREAVKDGKIGGTIAKNIAQHARGDKAKQKELVEKAIAAGKDKKKLKAVKAEVETSRRDKAAKIGRTLKIKPLSNEQLSQLGAKISAQLTSQLDKLGMAADADLIAWVKGSDADVKAAFSFGVLSALKAAAGLVVPLSTD